MSRKVLLPALAAFFLALAGTVHAQDLDRSVTLRIRNGTMENFLKEVTKETGILFSYAPSILPAGPVVQINARNRPLRKLLDEVLLPAGIRWNLIEHQVVLTRTRKEGTGEGKTPLPPSGVRRNLAGYLGPFQMLEIAGHRQGLVNVL